MAKKYKILKVMKVGSIVVGPGAATRENEEFAKVNAELVEVYDTNKNDVIAAAKDADAFRFPDGFSKRRRNASRPCAKAWVMT